MSISLKELLKEAKKRKAPGLSSRDYAKLRKLETLQYAGLGATAGPIVGGLSNFIMRGKPFPADASLKRWIPASMMAGAVYGGIVPILRRAVHERNLEMHRKTHRAKGLKKHASAAGQDLRLPVMGGTKMPTEDSKSFAASSLKSSQGAAEVGPTPSLATLAPQGPTIRDIAPHSSTSRVGSLPKLGANMKFEQDPLVKYLRKSAEALDTNWVSGPAESSNLALPEVEPTIDAGDFKAIEDNKEDMPKGKEEFERTSEDPHVSPDSLNVASRLVDYLKSQFDESASRRKKYIEKDFTPDRGLVDRVLGR